MPIRIPNDLPARPVLEREGVRVMDEATAVRQDIRPLRIGLLNLMPNKIETETQFARLIGATPLQIELTLIHPTTHQPKTVARSHLDAFYSSWEDIRDQKFDGFIVTGAPLGMMAFEDVRYWPELVEIMDWTRTNVHAPFFVCWGAMAALYHFYGVPKIKLEQKISGVFPHESHSPGCRWLLGFDDIVRMPVSRWTRVSEQGLAAAKGLRVLLRHEEAGAGLIDDIEQRRLFMINHLEYESDTLAQEYTRDLAIGEANAPSNYFPDNNPEAAPVSTWRAHGHLLISNWINEIYQTTPFNPSDIGQ
ncbi:MAG: homoserine O-succinyltransferase [Parvularculaceae bacterium]|nr:homoserine O-succinyltransferase [Parvularculaceae bacterium]